MLLRILSWVILSSFGFSHSSLPLVATIFRHDATQAVDVRLRQFVAVLLQILPRIPLGADELARDPVALRAGEIHREARADSHWHRTFFLPPLVLLEECRTHFFRAGGENFIHQPRRQSTRRNGIHIHMKSS